MFIPPSVGGRGVGVGGSGQCTIVWGGKLFISTQFPVAESVFCLSFKFWLNFRFFKIHGFDLIIFFCFSLSKILKLIHKLHRTVGCQNLKFHNFEQAFLASTGRSQNAYKTAKKWGKPPFSLLSKQDRRKRSLASLARAWPSFFGDKFHNDYWFLPNSYILSQKIVSCAIDPNI